MSCPGLGSGTGTVAVRLDEASENQSAGAAGGSRRLASLDPIDLPPVHPSPPSPRPTPPGTTKDS